MSKLDEIKEEIAEIESYRAWFEQGWERHRGSIDDLLQHNKELKAYTDYLLEQVESLRSAAWAAEKYITKTAVIFSHRNEFAVLDRLKRALEPYRIEEEQ